MKYLLLPHVLFPPFGQQFMQRTTFCECLDSGGKSGLLTPFSSWPLLLTQLSFWNKSVLCSQHTAQANQKLVKGGCVYEVRSARDTGHKIPSTNTGLVGICVRKFPLQHYHILNRSVLRHFSSLLQRLFNCLMQKSFSQV